VERAHDRALPGGLDLHTHNVHGDVHGAVAQTEQHRTHHGDRVGRGERERRCRGDEER
jgi:hypothetical protein